MQSRGGRAAVAGLVVALSLVGLVGSGCEKAGGGGGSQQTSSSSPPTTPTAPTTPTTPTTPSPTVVAVAGITMTADEPSLVSNGTSSTTITATLKNSIGQPSPDNIVVTFTTDKGRFTTDGAKSATATTAGGTGTVLVPFISEPGVVGTATVVASVKGVAQSLQITLTRAGPPAEILLTADATSISVGGTTGITAEVLDADENRVADGTAVAFTTSLAGTGVTPSAITTNGVATAVFSARTATGVATVTATAGDAVATIFIAIQPGSAGSLKFVSAIPPAIGVIGSPLPQKSTIMFQVLDRNGNPVADGTLVTFAVVSGVGGGEFVEPLTVGTVGGLAATVLTSGRVAGPVRVGASVTVVDSLTGRATTISSSSTNVSIVSGTPSAAHMGVAPAFLNIAGQVFQGIICPVTAIVGDRFGNPVTVILDEDSSGNPVLGQTPVSFYANGGVIGPVGFTDELGNAATEIKTGPPIPRVINSGDPDFNPNTDPRTGFVTIIAVTQGEETFIDSNGNGLFDGPSEFDARDPELDTPEPFIDHVTLCNGNRPSSPVPCPSTAVVSGDGQFDPNDRFELFIDGNSNRTWDRPNGMWDANKPIFASTRVLFSGPTVLRVTRLQLNGSCTGDPNGFSVPNGGAADFCILVSDPGGHPLVSGTTLKVTTSAGTLAGTTDVTLPDTQQSGPGTTVFTFAIIDDNPANTTPKSAAVSVSVTSPPTGECPGGNGDASFSFGGTIN